MALAWVDKQAASYLNTIDTTGMSGFRKGFVFPTSRYNPSGGQRLGSGRVVKASGRIRPGRYGTRALGSEKEKKFHDFQQTNEPILSVGVIQAPMLTIIQGTAEDERIGRKVFIRNINIRIVLELDAKLATTFAASTNVRFMVIQDKQANGGLPSVTNVLQTTQALSYRNLVNQGRFIVLKDKIITINHDSGAGNDQNWNQVSRIYKYSKKCNIPIEYNGLTGTIDEVRSNNIFILTIRSGAAATSNIHARFRFTD